LPETGKKLNEGVVVAVGPGAVSRDGAKLPMHVSVGETVLLPEYGGHTVSAREALGGGGATVARAPFVRSRLLHPLRCAPSPRRSRLGRTSCTSTARKISWASLRR
jgi:hypothetical protein